MASHGGRLLALGATLLAIPASLAPSTGAAPRPPVPTRAAAVPTSDLPAAQVRNREVLVRPRGGTLQRIALGPGADPVEVARRLRARPDLIESAGPNLIARAAGSRATPGGEAAQATSPTTPTATTPLPPTTTPLPAPTTPLTPVDPPSTDGEFPRTPSGLRGWIPDDHIAATPWASLQWNFVGRWGVGAPRAWQELRARRPSRVGGRGVRIAVVDSGVAYRSRGDYRQSPDLPSDRVLKGYDFVDEDRFPDDLSGHGTHVASLIAGATDNAAGLTGLAYEADILPIRVLDEADEGDVVAIARGIRYAVRRHADLINLSVDFPVSTTVQDIPEVMNAIEDARRAGILVIASSGNDGRDRVALPARVPAVLAVGATTVRGCRSVFSNAGPELDLVAPGGGVDHRSERGQRGGRCRPGVRGPSIAQVTLRRAGDPTTLGVPLDYVGTSMAAAHITAVAAMVRASGILGRDPSSELLAAYLVRSTRDLGRPGRDDRYGAGLIDAAAAVNGRTGRAAVRGARRAVAAARATTARSGR